MSEPVPGSAAPAKRRIDGRLRVGLSGLLGVIVCAAMPIFAACVVAGDTLRQPSFYSEKMADGGVFSRLEGRVVPGWVRSELQERFPTIEAAIVEEAERLASDTLSRAWFAETAQELSEDVTPWLDGREDGFATRVRFAGRLQTAADLFAARLPESRFAEVMYEAALDRATAAIEREEQRLLPFGLTVSADTWREALRVAAPRRWVAHVVGRQARQLAAYLQGRRDDLTIEVPLHERQTDLVTAIQLLVERSDTTAWADQRIVRPLIEQHVWGETPLGVGNVVLRQDEVHAAFAAALGSEWLALRRRDIVRTVANYLAGRSDSLQLTVPLKPLKVFAASYLAQIVDAKLAVWYSELDQCTGRQLRALMQHQSPELLCRPAGVGYEGAKQLAGIDIERRLREHLDTRIPDVLVQTEDRIRSLVGEDTWRLVGTARKLMRSGLVFTDQDMRAALREHTTDRLERLRRHVHTGWLITDHHVLATLDVHVGEAGVDGLAQFRRSLWWTRHLAWPLLLIVAVALSALAWLHGPGLWRGVEAAGWTLTTASLVVLLASLYVRLRLERLAEGARETLEGSSSSPVRRELAAVAPSVLGEMVDAIVVGLQGVALATAVVGVAGIVAARWIPRDTFAG